MRLFTEGLDVPFPTHQKYKDFSYLVDRVCKQGLNMLRDHVHGLEAADHDMKRCPRFKKLDDIAAITIHF